uniref:Theromacin n=1 Tax=Perinereis linea TaxID=2507842 RepID=A0A481MSN1_9ANNE|nr:theromacin [Perinereis linea]
MVAKISIVTSAVMMLLVMSFIPQNEAGLFRTFGKCWDTWSRCTRFTSVFTGSVWNTCQKRCQCLGHATGSCVLRRSECPLTSQAYRCECSGTRTGPRPSGCTH